MAGAQQDRLASCWRIQDCYLCIQSSHGCGWCPYSSTCVPTSSLLEPLSNAKTCPLRDERFELRTKALGCGCSTTTLLSIVVTSFATIVALIVLYGVFMAVYRMNRTFGTGTWRGVEVEIKDDGTRIRRPWRSGNMRSKIASVFSWTGHPSNKSEQEQLTERSRLLG